MRERAKHPMRRKAKHERELSTKELITAERAKHKGDLSMLVS